MTNVEKIVLDLYEEWATGPRNFASLVPLFELMKKKFPEEMDAAFGRGLALSRKLQSRYGIPGWDDERRPL